MSKYELELDIIRLNLNDYNTWKDAFALDIGDREFCDLLYQRDEWLKLNPQKNWFLSTSKWLQQQKEFRNTY